MDGVYRHMKHVYDLTRPLFLFGRAALRRNITPGPGEKVLEIGCGTGRNLVLLARAHPQAEFTGIDISREMLTYAGKQIAGSGLKDRVNLVEAELNDFASSHRNQSFDYIFFSYSLSMIPDWRGVTRQALEMLTPDSGKLLIVDFGSFDGWPAILANRFRKNMAHFHVTPRTGLRELLETEATVVEDHSLVGGCARLLSAQVRT